MSLSDRDCLMAVRTEFQEQSAKTADHIREAAVRLQEKDGEILWLKMREAEAVRLVNAVFGEYACAIKPLLSDEQIKAFEKNFAEPARAFLRATPTAND